MALSWVFVTTELFSPKRSVPLYNMLGTSDANFESRKTYNTQRNTVSESVLFGVCVYWSFLWNTLCKHVLNMIETSELG